MKTFRFLDFPVYKEGKILFQKVVLVTDKFPRKNWALADQLRRASLSVCLNIAEGSAKYSDKDFKRFVENSLGSINESVACLDVAFDIKVITLADFNECMILAESITKQLGGLSKKLRAHG